MIGFVLITAILSAELNEIDRTSIFSVEYKRCDLEQSTQMAKSYCLSDELKRQRIAMNAALRDQQKTPGEYDPVLAKSQELWRVSMKFDCDAEAKMGGSAAVSRALACEIGETIFRTVYLKTRGLW